MPPCGGRPHTFFGANSRQRGFAGGISRAAVASKVAQNRNSRSRCASHGILCAQQCVALGGVARRAIGRGSMRRSLQAISISFAESPTELREAMSRTAARRCRRFIALLVYYAGHAQGESEHAAIDAPIFGQRMSSEVPRGGGNHGLEISPARRRVSRGQRKRDGQIKVGRVVYSRRPRPPAYPLHRAGLQISLYANLGRRRRPDNGRIGRSAMADR